MQMPNLNKIKDFWGKLTNIQRIIIGGISIVVIICFIFIWANRTSYQASKPDVKEVQSIVNMMLSSVEGLTKAELPIADSPGTVLLHSKTDDLSSVSSIQMEYKLRVQHDLERRINEMLTPVFGLGHIISKVNIDIDFNQKIIRREMYVPEQNIILNIGDIKRLTVAVIIDGTYKKVNDTWIFIPRSADEISQIKLLVANAVGLNTDRGDALEISSIPFNDSKPPADTNLVTIIMKYSKYLDQPILNALLTFIFIILIIRPIVLALIRPKVEAGEVKEYIEGLPPAEEQLSLSEALEKAPCNGQINNSLSKNTEDDDIILFKDIESLRINISSLSEQHMDQVIVVMKGWLKNGEEIHI